MNHKPHEHRWDSASQSIWGNGCQTIQRCNNCLALKITNKIDMGSPGNWYRNCREIILEEDGSIVSIRVWRQEI